MPILNRVCTHEYELPGGSGQTIAKGTAVIVPLYGLQHDPKFYPEPEKFVPERFTDENKVNLKGYHPFGEGPRICIGMRLGKIQTKLSLAVMLHKYRYEFADSMRTKKMEYSTKTIITSPAGGIELKVRKR